MAATSSIKRQTGASAYESARTKLLRWGAIMAVIYLIYLVVFPLVPAISQSDHVLDIEMMLKDGMKWFAWLYVLGLGILFYAFWRVLKIVHEFSQADPESAKSLRAWVLGIGILCGVILIGLYPITALDVVLYVVRARLWALYGGSPMTALPAAFPQDPYISFAGEYANQPSPYGPVWELLAQIPVRLGILSMAGGVIAMKVISLISYAGMGILLGWHSRQETPRFGVSGATALTFFALNPLVLMEAIGNGHNDMLMLALLTLGLVLWQRENWMGATLALTLAVLIKATGLILMPLFGVAVLIAAPDWRERIRRALIMSVIFIVMVGISYRLTGPFPEVFQGAQRALFNRRGFAPSYFFYVVLHEAQPQNSAVALLPFKLAPILFVLYYAYLSIQLIRGKMTLLEAGFAAFFSQILLGDTFRIWYPLWLIPFAALNLNSRTLWMMLLFSVTAELSILSYYVLWRWVLRTWNWGLTGPLKQYWDYWTVTTVLTVPWTFGIPLIGPLLLKWKDKQHFGNSLWI